jgi:glycine/D-amino acid oxidase-like deaminating enzyme
MAVGHATSVPDGDCSPVNMLCMAQDHRNGGVSFWMHGLGPRSQRPPLAADAEADVVIVGGGMSGLWAAHHLLSVRPEMRVVVLEGEHVGYGASGRNGGWLSQLIPGNRTVYAAGRTGPAGVQRLQQAMLDGITDVVRVAADHGLDIDAHRGGNLVVATNRAGLARLEARRAADVHHGLATDRVVRLTPTEVAAHIDVRHAAGGLFYPDVTRINPAKLVVGLADALERRGVVIHEHSRVASIEPGRVVANGCTVRSPRVLIATEGYSGPLLGARRIVPINSSMIATQVLTDDEWACIGWRGMECLSDAAHTFIYAQRTADGRIAIGGRGNPYRFGSGTGGDGRTPSATVQLLVDRLHTYFPDVSFRVEHAWSGVLGVSRDWCTSVSFDSTTGIGHTVGYAGHGVTTAYAASRSLVDLALGLPTPAASLPWVDHRSRSWEPEPIRWIGVHSMYRLFRIADWWEERRNAEGTCWLGRAAGHLAGLHG